MNKKRKAWLKRMGWFSKGRDPRSSLVYYLKPSQPMGLEVFKPGITITADISRDPTSWWVNAHKAAAKQNAKG